MRQGQRAVGIGPADEQGRKRKSTGARLGRRLVGWSRKLRTTHRGPHEEGHLAEGDGVLGADQHAQLGRGARRQEVRPELEGTAEVAKILLGLAVLAPPPLELVGAPHLRRKEQRSRPLPPPATGASLHAAEERGAGRERAAAMGRYVEHARGRGRGRGRAAGGCGRQPREGEDQGQGVASTRRSCHATNAGVSRRRRSLSRVDGARVPGLRWGY